MRLLLERYSFEEKQTIGTLYLLNDMDMIITSFSSLELPWKDNKRRISSIPKGKYKAFKHESPKFGSSLWIKDVPGRSEILIHKGNFYNDTLGCILIGTDLLYIDNDNSIDVINSGVAITELLNYLKSINEINIEIVEQR